MEILFFIWLILLLPLLTAWLTRPDQALVMPSEADADHASHVVDTPTGVLPRLQATEFSNAYRQKALAAYREMLEMSEEDRRQMMSKTSQVVSGKSRASNATSTARPVTLALMPSRGAFQKMPSIR